MSSLRIILSIILLYSGSLFAQPEKPLTVQIPSSGTLGGRPVAAGRYTIEIDHDANEPYLRLIQAGKLIATEMAIVLPARGNDQLPSAQLIRIGKHELIRIQARVGSRWYFVYLKRGV